MVAGGNTKFDKLDVKRVYFGNWLRDYSQAIDVGGLKQLPAETIRILLWCLSFLTFGFATGEFEVTADRLGCYRPEEHIDNPKDYADNEDAREYDQRLRAPVDEEKELAIDPETGLKVYIASENAGCQTSAGLVRNLFEQSIELGRKYYRDHDKNDLYEALRLLGTGLHCLEDYAAHSNYTELALRELGVDAFPHVGRSTEQEIGGKRIFPLVTGTFGMTDFLHSVVGEMGDKVAQSEIEGLESQLNSASEEDEKEDKTSFLKSILDNVPWDMLEGDSKPDTSKADELKEASAAKKQEIAQNPLDPNASLGGVDIEQAKETAQQTLKDMYPILEFHDQVMKGVTEIISKVPGLDDLLENMSGALQIFIFSLLAPYVTPIIAQARLELKSTSEGVLKSSEKGQYEVFENDNSTDPTHSMLSKDHFSNVLNPVAGQIACTTVKFVVPHIVDSWSDEGKDVRETIDEILQVFHHPALRDENKEGQKAMFDTVKDWWEGKDASEQEHYKEILSAEGVKEGKNHEGENPEGGHSHGAPQKKKRNENEFVPSAQEGASVLSDLAGGLTGLVLEKTGLDKEFGSVGEDQRQNEQSSYGRSVNTYAGSGRDEEISGNSYGQSGRCERNNNNNNEESAYGGSGRSERNDESENTYGGGRYNRNDNEENSFGGFSGRDEENEITYGQSGRSGRGDNEESSYGGRQSYRNDNEESLYSGRSGHIEEGENTYSSRDDNQESSGYGRSGREENEQSYGYAGGREESSGYGGYNREDNESSGYGRGGREDNEGYGGSRGGENESSGYGRGGREDNEERSSGYGRREGHSYGEEYESNSRY
ncbi:heterokaryon incompatibility protein Het-C [Diplocarpon rosae]|nr:heterokaryon incompatibility protein Het-C [Diplocarpon rosae]